MENKKTSGEFDYFSDDLLGNNSSHTSTDTGALQDSEPRRKRMKDLWDSL